MTLAEKYSHQCGTVLPDSAPDFPTNFHPTPEKYITISAKSDLPEKDYDYFDIVVAMLHPILGKAGVVIIQLGLSDETRIPGTHHFQTEIKQTAYLVKHSLCHLTIDAATAHLAGNYGTPLVELFGPASTSQARPHYVSRHIFLEGKEMSEIKPEAAANAVLEILGVEDRIRIETSFIGRQFGVQQIDFIPNFRPNYAELQHCNLQVRMDYGHNEQILMEVLNSRSAGIAVMTRKPLSKEISLDKIDKILYCIYGDYKREDVLAAVNSKTSFAYFGPKENINVVRRDLNSPHNLPYIMVPLLPEIKAKPGSLLATRRALLSGSQMFSSLWHARAGIPGLDGVPIGDLESLDFMEMAQSMHIFSLKSD